jgi:hypothetical protein
MQDAMQTEYNTKILRILVELSSVLTCSLTVPQQNQILLLLLNFVASLETSCWGLCIVQFISVKKEMCKNSPCSVTVFFLLLFGRTSRSLCTSSGPCTKMYVSFKEIACSVSASQLYFCIQDYEFSHHEKSLCSES